MKSWYLNRILRLNISKHRRTFSTKSSTPKVLITGSCGQIGTELSVLMRNSFGAGNVVTSDVKVPTHELKNAGPFYFLDVTSKEAIKKIVVEESITWIVHLSSILSAQGERNLKLAMDLNIRSIENVLEIAREFNLRVFAPSSIAAFGPSTPQENTPDCVPMRPTTIYGVSKVYLELLGEYYNTKFGIDFRSLRYPGVLSAEAMPGGGTTDYAIDIFYSALTTKKYKCFLDPNVSLPMMYIPDCLDGTFKFICAENYLLTKRTYNLAAISFTPAQIAAEIKKKIPDFQIEYEPDFRNAIAWSWPRSLDDYSAQADWGWKHQFNLEAIVDDMLVRIAQKIPKDDKVK